MQGPRGAGTSLRGRGPAAGLPGLEERLPRGWVRAAGGGGLQGVGEGGRLVVELGRWVRNHALAVQAQLRTGPGGWRGSWGANVAASVTQEAQDMNPAAPPAPAQHPEPSTPPHALRGGRLLRDQVGRALRGLFPERVAPGPRCQGPSPSAPLHSPPEGALRGGWSPRDADGHGMWGGEQAKMVWGLGETGAWVPGRVWGWPGEKWAPGSVGRLLGAGRRGQRPAAGIEPPLSAGFPRPPPPPPPYLLLCVGGNFCLTLT